MSPPEPSTGRIQVTGLTTTQTSFIKTVAASRGMTVRAWVLAHAVHDGIAGSIPVPNGSEGTS